MPTNPAGYMQKYYKDNKDTIKKYLATKIYCTLCDKSVARANYTKHEGTKKHIRLKEKAKTNKVSRFQELTKEDLNNLKDININDEIIEKMDNLTKMLIEQREREEFITKFFLDPRHMVGFNLKIHEMGGVKLMRLSDTNEDNLTKSEIEMMEQIDNDSDEIKNID